MKCVEPNLDFCDTGILECCCYEKKFQSERGATYERGWL